MKNRIADLKIELQGHEETIKLLNDQYLSQIDSIKDTVHKVLDSNVSLRNKLKILFREQGLTIGSLLTAISMTLGFLVELFTPSSSSGGSSQGNSGKKDDAADGSSKIKKWFQNKLKALASFFGRLAAKAATAIPGIVGSFISWFLNRMKDGISWISEHLWSFFLGLGGLIYTYLMTRK